ncbi:hypothetical protein G7Y31_06745 [Corynebacterium lizhenjunii]|uniref:Uncharacterized protein n=1 Tax=Corynebacterium lizhenjunii TaxID=2709394 RepID=A0A7T0PB18_9CORY|nr:hypothetical protein [Corynebacterium lizhenjunii]QPK78282.1 hypothetical protein G7Y31_06745 [Corynebacterium lizhenjunii]
MEHIVYFIIGTIISMTLIYLAEKTAIIRTHRKICQQEYRMLAAFTEYFERENREDT